MSEQQIELFKMYLEQYRYEENEYIYSMFIERQFKYVELHYKDSLTDKKIKNYPVFSGLCMNRKAASICIFDISTMFNILFPTNETKKSFENLINAQSAQCPCCNGEIQFNYIVYDPFFMAFHSFVQSLKLEDDVIPILKFERVRKTNRIKYALMFPQTSQSAIFSGEITVEAKAQHFSIDQYSRMTNDIEKEISELEEMKKTQEGCLSSKLDEEIKLKQTVQNIIKDEHNRNQDQQPSTYLNDQQAFRILKVGAIDGTNFKSIDNLNIYSFRDNQLFIAPPSLEFDRKFQVFDLYKKTTTPENNLATLTRFDIKDEEFMNHRSILAYDSIIVLVTLRKIYQIQLINGHDKNNTKKELIVEEVYTIEREAQDDMEVPQICINKDNLFLMEYSESLQKLSIRVIEDIFVYPEERVIAQPEVYLEVSETSNKEKVLLLSDDVKGNVIILTPDQYFEFDSFSNKWEEHDLELVQNQTRTHKRKLNFYDFQHNEQYNSKGNKINYDDSDSDNDNEEEQKNSMFENDNDDDDDFGEAQDQQQMIERIFENTHNIIAMNTKEKIFYICNVKDGFIYKFNLQKLQIKQIQCMINSNIASENCVFQKKTIFYAVNVQSQSMLFNEISNEEDDPDKLKQVEELENQFNDYMELVQKQIQDLSSTNKVSPYLKDSIYCKNMAIYSTSRFI